MMRKIIFLRLFLLPGMLALAGCISRHTETIADLDPRAWPVAEPAILQFHNADTLSIRQIDIIMRLAQAPNVPVLPLNVTVQTPDSQMFVEPILVDLSTPYSHAVQTAARRSSKFVEITIPYRQDATLSQSGIYTFTFAHNRPVHIQGISAIGIKTTPQTTQK